jgi:glycosyltransferase involved in cell wall biosynthesis
MNHPIRVAFVLPDLRVGGAERVFLHLVEHIDRARIEPVLVLGEARGAWLDRVPSDVRVEVLGGGRARTAVPALVRALRRLRPDAAIATLGMTVALTVARPALPRSIRCIARLGNTVSSDLDAVAAHSPLRARLYGLLTRATFAACDAVVTQCDAMTRDARPWAGRFADRIVRIYNPVDIEALEQLARAPSANLPAGPNAVVIGSLKPQKGIDLLVAALPSIVAAHPGFTLHLAGEGDERGALVTQAAELGVTDAIVFHGTLANPFALARAAGLVISPSRFEGFSNAMLETAVLAIPQVVSDCPGGNREIIEERVNGYFARNLDSADLARAVNLALREASTLPVAQGAERLRERFGMKRICDEYAGLIESIVGHNLS